MICMIIMLSQGVYIIWIVTCVPCLVGSTSYAILDSGFWVCCREKIRHTQQAMSGLDASATKKMLGLEGEPFKFSHCRCKVTTTECSVLNGKVSDLESFIRDRVRA